MAPPLSIGSLRFAAIDFESAGKASEPIQIGIAIKDAHDLPPEQFFRSYLYTEKGIDWKASQIHGITEQDLLHAPSLPSLWPEVSSRLENRWVVAHGAGTERRYLRAFPLRTFGPWVDTLQLSRALYPHLPSYALSDLLIGFQKEEKVRMLCPSLTWHDALFDAVASLILLEHLIQSANLEKHPAALLKKTTTVHWAARRQKRTG